MTLEDKEIIKLQESMSQIIENHGSDFTKLFYSKLFELDPKLKLLFKSDINVQAKKLVQTLSYIIIGLSNLDSIVPVILEMGKKHTVYNVHDKDYEQAGVALIWSIEQINKDCLDDELIKIWKKAYNFISDIMINANKDKKFTTITIE